MNSEHIIKQADKLHREAMASATSADIARARGGSSDEAFKDMVEAFLKEREAVRLLVTLDVPIAAVEPSRSILCRSAAVLGLECGLLVNAARLVEAGLGGQPPDDIKHELEDLREEIKKQREKARAAIHAAADAAALIASHFARGVRRWGNALYSEAIDQHDDGLAAQLARRTNHLINAADLESLEALISDDFVDTLPRSNAHYGERIDRLVMTVGAGRH